MQNDFQKVDKSIERGQEGGRNASLQERRTA
jgi:hypothetical protein